MVKRAHAEAGAEAGLSDKTLQAFRETRAGDAELVGKEVYGVLRTAGDKLRSVQDHPVAGDLQELLPQEKAQHAHPTRAAA